MNTSPEIDDEQDLAQEVHRLLDLHRGQWKHIPNETGVSYSWLSKFMRGKIANPGYVTLRRLQRLLNDRPIKPPPLRLTTPPAPPIETTEPA